jgi:hypothetical protein
MTLRAFQGNRFEFLLEIFTLNSRRFYHDLPTVTLDAPQRSIVKCESFDGTEITVLERNEKA